MEVTLGIDIGGSTTKIAALLDRKQLLASLQVETPDQITSLYGAVGKLLSENSLPLEQISEIVLTGVGSTHIREDIYGIPTYKVDEFSACLLYTSPPFTRELPLRNISGTWGILSL